MAKTLHGKDAVKKVEEQLGRPLTLIERRVVEEEGYVDGVYKDTKGIVTSGVGQTGKYLNKSFEETLADHVKLARKLVPNLDQLPEDVQAELVQAAYRGDLGQSKKARSLINQGKFKEASLEFLNNKEYLNTKSDAIRRRMEKVSAALASVEAPAPKPVAKRPPQESLDALINQEYNNAVYPVKDTYRQEGFQLANPLLYPGYEP